MLKKIKEQFSIQLNELLNKLPEGMKKRLEEEKRVLKQDAPLFFIILVVFLSYTLLCFVFFHF